METGEFSEIDNFLPPDDNDPKTDEKLSTSSKISLDPEDELDMLSDSSTGSYQNSNDGYQAEGTDSGNESGSDHEMYFHQLDLSVLIKHIQAINNLMENNKIEENQEKIKEILHIMEDKVTKTLTLQTRKENILKQKQNRLLKLVQTKQLHSPLRRESFDGSSKSTPTQTNYKEIKIRVDQTSLLNSGVTKSPSPKLPKKNKISKQISSIRTNTDPPSTIPNPIKNRSSSFDRNNTSSFISDDSKVRLQSSQEILQERYLTFIEYYDDEKTRDIKCGHILDILEWIVNHEEICKYSL